MSKKFKRQDNNKHKKLGSTWRKARGRHSRVRLEKKGAMKKPKIGYRAPEESRGIHPSGYEDVLVHNVSELEDLEEGQAARIASSVGGRKREQMLDKAEELDIKVLNRGGEQ